MSFRQPAPITIRSYHFKENVYTFSVESVLESNPGQAGLQIIPSAGYLLKTPSGKSPQPELTLHYAKQDDGSYVARDTITLLVPGPAFLSGSVTLRDPLGEEMTLPVHIETILTVDDSPILFNEIEPGNETFAILKIGQYGADTPVIVSVDGSDYFTLAPGRTDPTATTTLTLTPTYTGTYIYIRYAPEKVGRHTATLLVDAPYSQQHIFLEGRSIWLSGWYRLPQRLALRAMLNVQDRLPPFTKAQKMGVGAVLGLALLATGYLYRCELAPSLCQSETVATDTTASNRGLLTLDSSKQNLDYEIGKSVPLTLPKSEEYPWIGSGDNAGLVSKPAVDSLRPKRRWRTLPQPKPVDSVQNDTLPRQAPRPAKPVVPAAQDSVTIAEPPVRPLRQPRSLARAQSKRTINLKSDSLSAKASRPKRFKRKRRPLYPGKPLVTAMQESELEKELNRKTNKLP
ncbi:hypothetical protein ACFQ4C_19900 [Larkinella insperata]|uniref:Uncharacterized protein n=1 Tax=Larkinella insperata TaxID=332158 RepID=A0ABW3QGT5_9BACT|nr:hypothetical protein [Larkinella insperata]